MEPLISEELEPQQQRAAILLAAGFTGAEVARRVITSEQTICAWRKTSKFMSVMNAVRLRLEAALEEQLRAASQISLRLTNRALSIIDEGLNSSDPKIRLRSAEFVVSKSSELAAMRIPHLSDANQYEAEPDPFAL